MCGIFALLNGKLEPYLVPFNSTKHRGPDNTKMEEISPNLHFGFHRLCINGLDRISDQPIHLDSLTLICNGEIYNYSKLAKQYGFSLKTNSDCEIILHMFQRFGIEETCKQLDGVFSFIIYDQETDTLYIVRDPIGIRSMYYGSRPEENQIVFCSEMKGITPSDNIKQFPPGFFMIIKNATDSSHTVVPVLSSYFEYKWIPTIKDDEKEICNNIRRLFIDAVNKRTMSDRPICSLLSGGLDSTLTTYVLAHHTNFNKKSYLLNTYAIGLPDSVDLKFAEIASKAIGTNHHTITVTEEEFLAAIEKTIIQIESYCVTSVRASVGNFLVCLAIAKCPDADTVIFCGDLSDEIFGSYRGFMKAPSSDEFFKENVEMVKDVHYFDVLRSDKSISGAGLEARVPFADKEFVNYVMSLDPTLKQFDDEHMEKYLLRKAFDGELPDSLLWRRKEAFSDGVSGMERSWFQIIQEHVDKLIPDEEFETRVAKYSWNIPTDKESLWYRELYEKHYPGTERTIPYMWKHPFHDKGADPSARLLDCYKHE